MTHIFDKFKNIHFLWLVGLICFLSFYVPIRYFTTYLYYPPEWTIPIFIFSTMIPLWFNEFLWRTASFASDSYIVFHDLHFEGKKWKKRICNPFYIIYRYSKWLFKRFIFWVSSVLLIFSLIYGFIIPYDEELLHPFTPFYIINTIWWIGIIRDFNVFKNEAREGRVRYKIIED